jgi:hypothetical protein
MMRARAGNLISAIAVLVSSRTGVAALEVYCLSGTANYLPPPVVQGNVQPSADQGYALKLQWEVLIDGTRWRIKIGRKFTNPDGRIEVGCDGTTVYSVNYMKWEPSFPTNSNDSIAVIESGVLPYESDLTVHPVWLAFCAPELVALFPDHRMPSIDKIGGAECIESRFAKFEFRYQLLDQSKYFEKFELLDDGYGRTKLKDRTFKVLRRNPPFDKGFVKTRLQTEGVGLFGTQRIPSRLLYQRLVPSGGTNDSATVLDAWTLIVTSAYPTNVEDLFWLPRPTGNTDVHDRRFAQSSPPVFALEYRLRSRSWMKKNDPFLVQMYETSAGITGHGPQSHARYKRIIVFAFVAFSAAALAFLIWKNRKRVLSNYTNSS